MDLVVTGLEGEGELGEGSGVPMGTENRTCLLRDKSEVGLYVVIEDLQMHLSCGSIMGL